MDAGLDARRHRIDQPGQPAVNAVEHVVAEMARHDTFEQRELDRRLPLDRQLFRRDRRQDLLELPAERAGVGGLEQGARARHDVDARHRKRRRQADLEAPVRCNDAFPGQAPERREGVDRRGRVAELRQFDLVGRRHALDRLIRRHRDIDRIDFHEPELRALADARMLPLDPVVALADLAVGQALEMPDRDGSRRRGTFPRQSRTARCLQDGRCCGRCCRSCDCPSEVPLPSRLYRWHGARATGVLRDG